jgi:hypothetical protein
MRLTWVQADAGRSDDGHISPVRLQSSQLSRGSGTVALLQFAQTSTQQSTEPTAAARPTGRLWRSTRRARSSLRAKALGADLG